MLYIVFKIKEIAEKENITRYAISKGTGITEALLQRYWSGETSPSFEKILKILDFLGYYLELKKRE